MRPDREIALTLDDLSNGIDRDQVVASEWLRHQRAGHRAAEEQ